MSDKYLEVLKTLPLEKVQASGVYPLPMISHSIDFPFSLMPAEAELKLVERFESMLEDRRQETQHHPWLCDENYGQAFLLWGQKV